ncbi:MAG: GAF domain-containing protein [Phototrophicaceae bacterium]
MTNMNVLALRKQASINTPELLLEQALSLISNAIPAIQSAQVFQVARGGLVMWQGYHSDYDNGMFVPIAAQSPYQDAIEQQSIIATELDGVHTVTAAIVNQYETFALLEIKSDQALDPNIIVDFADDLGLLLHTQVMDRLLHQQISITGQLSIATSLIDVANIIANTVLQAGQFVSVNTIHYENDEAVGGRVIATANRQQAYTREIDLALTLSEVQQFHDLLQQDGEVLVSDLSQDERFSAAGKQWLSNQNINSIYMMPLWVNSRLSAFIGIADTQQVFTLTHLEKELFQNIAHQASIAIEKQHLLEQSQVSAQQSNEQVRVLRLINALVSEANSGELDKPLLQKTSDILLDITDVDHVGIVMREGDQAYVVSEAPSQGFIAYSIEMGADSIHSLLEKTRVPIIVPDVEKDDVLPSLTKKSLIESNIQSIVILPMFDENDQLMGSVGLDYFSKRDNIDENIVEIAQTVVTQVALSLQNIRLLSESQQKAQQLEQLTNFGQSLRAYLTLEEILQTTLNYAPSVIGAEYTSILLYDRSHNTIRNSARYFQDESKITLDGTSITESDNSIALQAWTTHETVHINDLHAGWDWKHPLERELQSLVALPLRLAGVMLGVLEIGSLQAHHFNTTDLATMQQISNQLAIALSNATAYAQSQQVARNKTQANDIIAKLQQQLEVGDILNVTIQELGKAIGAKKARIRLGTSPSNIGES